MVVYPCGTLCVLRSLLSAQNVASRRRQFRAVFLGFPKHVNGLLLCHQTEEDQKVVSVRRAQIRNKFFGWFLFPSPKHRSHGNTRTRSRRSAFIAFLILDDLGLACELSKTFYWRNLILGDACFLPELLDLLSSVRTSGRSGKKLRSAPLCFFFVTTPPLTPLNYVLHINVTLHPCFLHVYYYLDVLSTCNFHLYRAVIRY